MPSSPGTAIDPLWGAVAHEKRDGAVLTANAAPEICFRKLRLEFIAFQRAAT